MNGSPLLARMTVSHCDSKALEIEWTKVQSVEGYDVFFARCGRSFKLKQSVSGNTSQFRPAVVFTEPMTDEEKYEEWGDYAYIGKSYSSSECYPFV